jgi:CMP-N-acetylneuraminic acid synthetase
MSKDFKNIVAIIPARGGSKGLPKKNILPLCGKPLIAYTIEAAKGCKYIDRVVVSTEDPEIARIAREWGAEVPFMRPKVLAQDDTHTEPVLKHAVEWLEENEGYIVDIVVYLQITNIFRKRWMLDEVVKRLLERDDLHSCFVAYKTHKNYWRKKEEGFVRLAKDIYPYGPRQKKEPLFREDTGIACATRGWVIKEGKRVGEKVDIVVNDDEASFIDIHDPFTFWLAERILLEGRRTVND